MKTLSKLNINPGKLIKNDELIALRGGSVDTHCQPGDPPYVCYCSAGGGSYFVGCFADQNACKLKCQQF